METGDGDTETDKERARPDGTTARALYEGAGLDAEPAWSADSRWVLFATWQDEHLDPFGSDHGRALIARAPFGSDHGRALIARKLRHGYGRIGRHGLISDPENRPIIKRST